MYGVFHRLFRYLTADTIGEVNLRVNGWIVGGTFALGVYFEGSERLTLLSKDSDHVGRGAATKRDEHEFHRAVGGFFFAGIHNDCVAGTGLPYESFLLRPI